MPWKNPALVDCKEIGTELDMPHGEAVFIWEGTSWMKLDLRKGGSDQARPLFYMLDRERARMSA